MTLNDRWLTLQSIREHEGFSPAPVADTGGSWVVGFGWNPSKLPITKGQANTLLEDQVMLRESELERAWPPYLLCDGPRQRCLLEMSYQLGVAGLLTFTKMLHAIAARDYPTAALEVINSQLAKQTPSRVADYADMLKED